MVDSDLIIEKVEDSASDNFRRVPSFSGWCDDNGTLHSAQLGNVSDDFDFELPLVNQNGIGNGSVDAGTKNCWDKFKQTMNGGGDMAAASTGNGKDRYVPFDVENCRTSDQTYSNGGGEGSTYADYRGGSKTVSKNVVSIADVLKTLFLILVQ